MQQFFETSQGLLAIGAILGAGCVTLGTLVPSFMSLLSRRRSATGERSAAMQAVLALDDFVGSSYAAVHDTPEFNPVNEGEFVFHTPDPVLALPSPDRLELLDEELAEEIMWLGNRVLNLGHALDALDLSARNFDGFFERRKEGYAVLAAQAMDLIDRLIAEHGLRMPEKPDYYRQREGFVRVLQDSGESRQSTQTARHAVKTPGSNVTQLFPKASEDAD